LNKVELVVEWISINRVKGCEKCNGGKHAKLKDLEVYKIRK